MRTNLFLALLLLLLPGSALAQPTMGVGFNVPVNNGQEKRCADLGDECICSETLDANFTATADGWMDPPPSVGDAECDFSSTKSLYSYNGNSTVAASSVGMPTGSTVSYVYESEAVQSKGKLDYPKTDFTDGTHCVRYYERFETGFPGPANNDQNIKEGRNEKEGGEPHPCTESDWAPGPLGTNSEQDDNFTRFAPKHWCLDDPYAGKLEAFGQGDTVTSTISLEDCTESWCRFERCYDHNESSWASGDADKLQWRFRVTKVSDGTTWTSTPQKSPDAQTSAHSGSTSRIFSTKTGEGGFDTVVDGYSRYFSHAMVAQKDVADEDFWIGAACEIEGGCE